MDESIARIKQYLETIDRHVHYYTAYILGNDEEALDFIINEVIDRVLLYLNSDTIPKRLERILANVINTACKRCIKNHITSKKSADLITKYTGDSDMVITNISDNGQSITYANELRRYFSTVSDEELFGGVASLLSRYRRVKVVYPKRNENGNR